MNEPSPNTSLLPRRRFLTVVGVTALTATVPSATVQAAPTARSSVKVTISGTGGNIWGVVAHFRLPDGTSTPFYAWNGGENTSIFIMPLTREGLRMTIESAGEGGVTQDITLRRMGTHTLAHPDGESQIYIAVTPV
jgi:hypothetical protein